MGKRILEVNPLTKPSSIIFLSIFFIIASISTFYGVRVGLPAISNLGRGLLVILPAILTYGAPLFLLIMFYAFTHARSISHRWRLLHVSGATLMLTAGVSTFLIVLLLPTSFKGQFIFGGASPLYPLDVFIFSICFFVIGLALCLLALNNVSSRRSLDHLPIECKRRNVVLMSFFLAFATYFFGEFIFGIHYLFELPFVDKNWPLMLITYLAFPLLALTFIFHEIYSVTAKEKKDMRYTTFMVVDLFIMTGLTIAIVACIFINPYYISESMQYEFSIGLKGKIPLGLFVILVWNLTVILVSLIKFLKTIKRKIKHEQK